MQRCPYCGLDIDEHTEESAGNIFQQIAKMIQQRKVEESKEG